MHHFNAINDFPGKGRSIRYYHRLVLLPGFSWNRMWRSHPGRLSSGIDGLTTGRIGGLPARSRYIGMFELIFLGKACAAPKKGCTRNCCSAAKETATTDFLIHKFNFSSIPDFLKPVV